MVTTVNENGRDQQINGMNARMAFPGSLLPTQGVRTESRITRITQMNAEKTPAIDPIP